MSNWLKGYSPKQIKEACQEFAHFLGRTAASGWIAADRLLRGLPFATDGAKWVTAHPNGRGYNNSGEKIKGTPVLIDEESGEVLGGAGGKLTGKHFSKMPKRGANAVSAQHDIERVRMKREDQEGFAQRQKELIAKRDQQLKQAQEEVAKVKAEAERKAKEAQEQQAKEQAAAQQCAQEQRQEQEQTQAQQPPMTTRQAVAQKVIQAIADNPLPEEFKTSEQVEAYCKRAYPSLVTDAFYFIEPKAAHSWLQGLNLMVSKFPGLIGNSLSGFNSVAANEYNYNQALKKYKRYIAELEAEIRNIPEQMEVLQNEVNQRLDYDIRQMRKCGTIYPLQYGAKMSPGALKQFNTLCRSFDRVEDFSPEETKQLIEIARKGRLEHELHSLAVYKANAKGILPPKKTTYDPTIDSKTGNVAVACYIPSWGQIWPGTKYYGKKTAPQLEESAAAAIARGFTHASKDGVDFTTATCVHEIAHSLDKLLDVAVNNKATMSNELSRTVNKLWYEYQEENKGKTASDIYALYDIHEFFC